MRVLLALVLLALLSSNATAQALKSGDSLSITVLQDPKLDRTVVIDPRGEIAFPLAGHIRARGLTPLALENILKNKLKSNYKDGDLDVTVAVANAPKDIPEDDLKPKVFKSTNPRRIAVSLKRSAQASKRRKGTPYQSAMSMLNFYINRAGKSLPKRQKHALEQAKDELRDVLGRE